MTANTFNGRVEAKIIVPTGGAAFQASNGAQTSSQTLTIPAGGYFMTGAGGVSGILATMKSLLNNNIQGYPLSAVSLQQAIGFGGFGNAGVSSAGWMCNETSGSLATSFGGSLPFAPVSSPTYNSSGPAGGIDLAVGFDSAADAFSAGNIFQAGSNDLVIGLICKCTSASVDADWVTKGWNPNPGYILSKSAGNLIFWLRDGVVAPLAQASLQVGNWMAVLAVIDRGANKVGVATMALGNPGSVSSATASLSGLGSLTNATALLMGAGAAFAVADQSLQVSAIFMSEGVGAGVNIANNLNAAVTNLANAASATWDVSLSSSNGNVTISNSFWSSSVDFTNTTLRDVLGFPYDFDYPLTPAATTATVGYGAWTTALMLNETVSPLVGSYGGTNLQLAFGTPLFNLPGVKGGSDKSVSHTDGAASILAPTAAGASYLDLLSTVDLALMWVGYLETAPGATRSFINKWDTGGGGKGYHIRCDPTVGFGLFTRNSGGTADTGASGLFVGEPHVGIAVIERATGKMRIGTRGIRSGATAITAEATITATDESNAFQWQMGSGAGLGATPLRVSAFYGAIGVGACTGLSANLGTALLNFATYMKSATGNVHCRGVWRPDCPFNVEGDPRAAPLVSDLRQSMGPTGQVIGFAGNTLERHRAAVWSHVPEYRTWERRADLTYASWEWFYKETQLGLGGTTWFKLNSPVQIYDHNSNLCGGDFNSGVGTTGWSIVGLRSVEPKPSIAPWTGRWRVEIPTLIAQGS